MPKSLLNLLSLILLSISAFAQLPANYPSNGMLGFWPLDSNVQNIFSSSHQGSAVQTVPATNRFGEAGKALYLNGLNAYGSLPSSIMGSLTSNNFTVSVWVAPDTIPVRPGGTEILADRNTSTWNYRFSIGYGSNAVGYEPDSAYFESIMGSVARKVNATGPQVGQWIQYVYVHSADNNGTVRSYANGQLINIRTGIGWNSGARGINIGRSLYPGAPTGGNYFFKGRVDEIAIWSRPLSPAEVANLYNPCLAAYPIAPVSRAVIAGDSVHLVVGNIQPSWQYQWQVSSPNGYVNLANNAAYAGTNTNTLVILATTQSLNGLQYRCVVSNGSCLINTQPAFLQVICQSQIAQQPNSVTQTIAGNAQFQILANNGNATYQWQLLQGQSFQNLTNFGQYSGVNTSTLQIQSLTFANNGQLYRCIVGGQNCDDTSSAVTLFVQCLPQITAQPLPTSGLTGGNAQFNVQAPGSGSSFQWQRRTSQGGSFIQLTNNGQFNGVSTSQLQIQSLGLQNNNDQYRCIVSNLGCNDTSTSAVLSVSCANQISQQPRDTLVRPGAEARFEVNFSAGVLFAWYRIAGITLVELQNDSVVQGANTYQLRLLNVPINLHNTVYVCVMVQGACSDTSEFAILRVSNTASVDENRPFSLQHFPNPANQSFYIKRNQATQPVKLRVTDLLGRVFFEADWKEEDAILDVSLWPEGTYFLQAGPSVNKFIVRH